jgi:nicotinate phosphoribosyltransferase
LRDVTIFASGGLDEEVIAAIVAADSPIDGLGVGTALTTSSDVPALDCAYKLEEYAGRARRKHSPGKATWPGRKQVWRRYDSNGRMSGDILSVDDDRQEGEALLQKVMGDGSRLGAAPRVQEVRRHAAEQLERLPDNLRRLGVLPAYPVHIANALEDLAKETDSWIAAQRRIVQ